VFLLAPVVPHSSGVQQPMRATAILGRYQHTRWAAPLTANRSAPVATDQKVGGSSPSERATISAGQGLILGGGQGPRSLSSSLPSQGRLPRFPIVQLAGTASRPPSGRRFAMASPA